MMSRFLSFSRLLSLCASGVFLTGCAADVGPSPYAAGGPAGIVRTYTYYDANHPDGISGQPSPQAIYNVNHGTWLWPPATSNDRRP
jgi:hypothetical protein